MTLIIGLKSASCVVVGAEQEEAGGYTSKRSVTKLKLLNGKNWSVVIGGAGDATIAENGMRAMQKKLQRLRKLDEDELMKITDEVLDLIHTKYIDKDPKCEGVSFVIGASCDKTLHLISTTKRVPQLQQAIAFSGYGSDIGAYFLDRLHRDDEDWIYCANVAGFTLQQAIESAQFCSGESEIFILQCPPSPRWRCIGHGDVPIEFMNSFSNPAVAVELEALVRKNLLNPEHSTGYQDELHPDPKQSDDTPIETILNAMLQKEKKRSG